MNLLRSAAALALAATVSLPAAALAASTIPGGSTITGQLQQTLDTKNLHNGDTFTLLLSQPPYPNDDPAYQNATIYGHVENVVSAGSGRKAGMNMVFDRITLADGETAPIAGTVTQMQTQKENTAQRQAIGTVVGDVVGNYLGKVIGGGLANWGWAAGAAGGYLYSSNVKSNFSVPAGTTVAVKANYNVTPSSTYRQQQQQYPQGQYPQQQYPPQNRQGR